MAVQRGFRRLSSICCLLALVSGAKQRKPRVRGECAPELGLLDPLSETARSYAQNFQRFCNTSSPWAEDYRGLPEVMGFVAPWSDHGYRAARYFRGKFSLLSPLWFRILPGNDASSAFEVVGWDIAKEQERWTKQASSEFCLGTRCGDGPEVLPHFSFEGFERLQALKAALEAPVALAAELAVICEKGSFQGVVLDVRAILFPSLKPLLPPLIAEIARAMRSAQRRLFLSVPAMTSTASRGPAFNAADAAAVAKHVDGIIVGTRDFSRKEPGPSAPLEWMRFAVKSLMRGPEGETGLLSRQLLLEIPTYGRAFQEGSDEGRVIAVLEIAKALAKQKPKVEWNQEVGEHSVKLKKSRAHVAMPSLAFVAERLKLARELGTGIALRDLSSGLDAAFDLLPDKGEWSRGEEESKVAAEADDMEAERLEDSQEAPKGEL